MTGLAQMISALEHAVNDEPFDPAAVKQAVAVLRWVQRYYDDLKPLALIFDAFPGAQINNPEPSLQDDEAPYPLVTNQGERR